MNGTFAGTKRRGTTDIQKVPYNEIKFLVTNDQLETVLHIMIALYGNSDPFQSGIVDTLYYDTPTGKHFNQCRRGDSRKSKYRIRGYGNNTFLQLHHKKRNLEMVSKEKYRIVPLEWEKGLAPEWRDVQIKQAGQDGLKAATSLSRDFLIPVLRVTYLRYRFRIKDYRLTLDTRIEVSSPTNGWITRCQHAVLPNHVLEIKTTESRPHLPLLGLVKLAPGSFSKFKQGLEQLQPIF